MFICCSEEYNLVIVPMVPTYTICGTRSWKSTHKNQDYCSYLNESDSILVVIQLETSHSYDPKLS